MAHPHANVPAKTQDILDAALRRMRARDASVAAWLSPESEALAEPGAPEVVGLRSRSGTVDRR
jgi:hypothetical protein